MKKKTTKPKVAPPTSYKAPSLPTLATLGVIAAATLTTGCESRRPYINHSPNTSYPRMGGAMAFPEEPSGKKQASTVPVEREVEPKVLTRGEMVAPLPLPGEPAATPSETTEKATPPKEKPTETERRFEWTMGI